MSKASHFFSQGVVDAYYPSLNLISRERLDPVLSVLFEVLALPLASSLYEFGVYLIFLLGAILCSRELGHSWLRSLMLGVLTLIASLFVIGRDPFYFRLHWLPLFFASLLSLRLNGRVIAGFSSLVSGLMLALTAGSLSVSAVLFSFSAAWLVSASAEKRSPRGRWEKLEQARRHSSAIFIFLLVFLLPFSVLVLPVPENPIYPAGARLTPISPLSFLAEPLLGYVVRPESLLYHPLLELGEARAFRALLIVLIVIVLSALVGRRLSWADVEGKSGLLVLVLGYLSLATAFVAGTASVLPFEFLRQVVPGLAFTPLSWLFYPVLFLFAFPFALRAVSLPALGIANLVVIMLGACFLGTGTLPLVDTDPQRAGSHFQRLEWDQRLMRSPSAYVVKTFGEWVTDESLDRRELRARSLRELPVSSLSASVGQDAVSLAADGNIDTRWSTAGPQKAGDWFEIEFSELTPVLQVKLATATSHTDFPRGLQLHVEDEHGVVEEVLKFSEWLGPLRVSSDGYPYFGPQPDVTIDLPRQYLAKRLRFTQLGVGAEVDWSIHEIVVYSE